MLCTNWTNGITCSNIIFLCITQYYQLLYTWKTCCALTGRLLLLYPTWMLVEDRSKRQDYAFEIRNNEASTYSPRVWFVIIFPYTHNIRTRTHNRKDPWVGQENPVKNTYLPQGIGNPEDQHLVPQRKTSRVYSLLNSIATTYLDTQYIEIQLILTGNWGCQGSMLCLQ